MARVCGLALCKMEEIFCFISWEKLRKQVDELRTSLVYLVMEGEGVKKIPW